MQKINCLADAINHTPRVRVINKWDELYNQEFELASNCYNRKEVAILIKDTPDGSEVKLYNYSEIQFLTPVQYEWRYIGFGDEVNWLEVYGYCWADNWWRFCATQSYLWYCFSWNAIDIESFEPLNQLTPKIELTTEEMITELKRRWVVTEGKIINN